MPRKRSLLSPYHVCTELSCKSKDGRESNDISFGNDSVSNQPGTPATIRGLVLYPTQRLYHRLVAISRGLGVVLNELAVLTKFVTVSVSLPQ